MVFGKHKDAAYYERQLEAAKQRKVICDKRAEVAELRRQSRRYKPPTTTKIIVALIFLNCTVVEAYAMAAMWYLQNLDALYALVSAVVGESVSFAVYAAKAYSETKQEEIIKLQRDQMEAGKGQEPEPGAEQEENFG